MAEVGPDRTTSQNGLNQLYVVCGDSDGPTGRCGDEPTAGCLPPRGKSARSRSFGTVRKGVRPPKFKGSDPFSNSSFGRIDSSRHLIIPDGKRGSAIVKGFPAKVACGRGVATAKVARWKGKKNQAGPTSRTLPTSTPKPAQSTPWPCGRGGVRPSKPCGHSPSRACQGPKPLLPPTEQADRPRNEGPLNLPPVYDARA